MDTETAKTTNGHGSSVPPIKQALVKDSVENPGTDLVNTFGKGLIYKKMIAIMKEIGPVSKDQQNTVQNFKFRGIDQFINALHPALVKHGVFVIPSCTSHKTELKEVTRSNGKTGVDKHVEIQMTYTFVAEDGSSVTLGPIPAEGLDSGDKATNKALSAALKYTLIQGFEIPTEDMAEGDSESPEIGVTKKESPQNTAPAQRRGFTAPQRNTPPPAEKPQGEANTQPQAQTQPAPAQAAPSQPTPAPQQAPAPTEQPVAQNTATATPEAQASATTTAAPALKKERARFNPPKKDKPVREE